MADLGYTLGPARYAKGMVAVRCPSDTGYKTRAGCLASALARRRYTGREDAYIMSPTKAAKFERLYAEGWDANFITDELIAPDPARAADSAKSRL